MIKTISFDFYNTLARFWPPLDEIQQAACRELGLVVSKPAINQGYAVADVYFNQENSNRPLALRNDDDRRGFFARYEQIILKNAGVPVSIELAQQIWEMAMSVPKDFIPFEDVIPALKALRSAGYRLGVLSNLRRNMDQLCHRLGFSPYLDFCLNSADVGAEKPNAPIFMAALESAATSPEQAMHVGDQYRSDVLGARAVGIHPVLIDRGGHSKASDCPRIASLTELPGLLTEALYSSTGDAQQP